MKKTIIYLLSGILLGFSLLFNSYGANSKSFSGGRDVISPTQDGVKTIMKIVDREVQEPLENLLVNSTFTWIDNGRTLGTITFTSDRVAHPSWSNSHHTWRLEANNNLLVSGNGTQYVARLKWNSNSQSFSGRRDVTSQVQDGVKTVMKMVERKVERNVDREVQEPLENLLVNSTFTWIDNGRTLGTITFTSDRVAHPSWSNSHHTWRLEANNNLIVSGNGTQYVARLKWNSNSQSFSGGRDATSRTQDGVKTVMKMVERLGNSSGITTIPIPVSSQPVLGNILFQNGNKSGVFNGAKSNTYFYVGKTTTISSILNYHWNNGNGSKPGQIGLRNARGTILGTWQSEGSDGMRGVKNANWTVYPNITLQPGIYQITDSEPSTWSHNNGSYGSGFSIVYEK